MAISKKKALPPDFKNPFEGRNADEVWQELKKNAKPVSREEVLKRMQAQKGQTSSNDKAS